ncbi:MAG: PAS domain S-box protein, partial [Bacteroidota bacterium]
MKRKTKNNKNSFTDTTSFNDINDNSLFSVLQNLPVAVIIYSSTRLLFLNKKAIKLLKITKTQEKTMSGHSVLDFIPTQYHKLVKSANKSILAGQEPDSLELKIKNIAGEITDVEFKSNTITLNGKTVIQTVITDISARINSQDQLIEVENNLQVILRGIDEVVYYVD